MKNRKVHLVPPAGGSPICGAAGNLQATRDQLKVTCKNCLKLVGNKTTIQGGKPWLYNLVLDRVNSSEWINTIKIVREITQSGLKEAKDVVDAVRQGEPQTILKAVSQEEAEAGFQLLLNTSAGIQITRYVEEPKTPLVSINPIHIEGFLEIDSNRGVIYFHSKTGQTLLRICSLPTPIPLPVGEPSEVMLDITHGYGVSWSSAKGK